MRRVYREAAKAYRRLLGLKDDCYRKGLDLGELRHVMVSPPPEQRELFLTKDGYGKLNKKALRYFQDIGVIGGAGCWHLVRGKPSVIRAYKRHELELPLSPHMHTVGYMPEGHQVNADNFHEATGWIYKNIPIVTQGGAANVLHYELSHAAHYPTSTGMSHALRWWGASSYSKIKVQLELEREQKLCHDCKADLHKYQESYDCDLGPAVRIREIRKFTLTPTQFEGVVKRLSSPQPLKPRPEQITAYEGVMY